MFVCLMIVSIDTIKCDRQIVLFFGQETVVVVETCEIPSFIFFKKRLLLSKKHFETGMLMSPKNIGLLTFYGTSSTYSYNSAQRSKDICQMQKW